MEYDSRHSIIVAEGTEAFLAWDMPESHLSIHTRAQKKEIFRPCQFSDHTLMSAIHQQGLGMVVSWRWRASRLWAQQEKVRGWDLATTACWYGGRLKEAWTAARTATVLRKHTYTEKYNEWLSQTVTYFCKHKKACYCGGTTRSSEMASLSHWYLGQSEQLLRANPDTIHHMNDVSIPKPSPRLSVIILEVTVSNPYRSLLRIFIHSS